MPSTCLAQTTRNWWVDARTFFICGRRLDDQGNCSLNHRWVERCRADSKAAR